MRVAAAGFAFLLADLAGTIRVVKVAYEAEVLSSWPESESQEEARELAPELAVEEGHGVEHHLVNCSNTFEVFPYIQPGLWGTYTGWETCGEGRSQSPINIPAHARKVSPRGPLDLTFNALKKPVILNNGHNAEIEGEFLEFKLAGNTYSAKQFHFHTPSEHRVAGRGFAMEMHIVTKTEVGEAAVIGILFEVGNANRCLTEIRKLPNAGCEDHVNMTVDLACFEEQLAGPWWSYDGSLTTPPCSEGVKWQVMQKKATLSLAQLLIFRSRFKLNARPPQPLNGREVRHHSR